MSLIALFKVALLSTHSNHVSNESFMIDLYILKWTHLDNLLTSKCFQSQISKAKPDWRDCYYSRYRVRLAQNLAPFLNFPVILGDTYYTCIVIKGYECKCFWSFFLFWKKNKKIETTIWRSVSFFLCFKRLSSYKKWRWFWI